MFFKLFNRIGVNVDLYRNSATSRGGAVLNFMNKTHDKKKLSTWFDYTTDLRYIIIYLYFDANTSRGIQIKLDF